jgi:hypothetical protein
MKTVAVALVILGFAGCAGQRHESVDPRVPSAWPRWEGSMNTPCVNAARMVPLALVCL